jgi:hypothetical protein
VASGGVLFWNEGGGVKQQRTLDDGEKIVVPITDVETDNPRQYYSKLVYLTGLLEAKYDDDGTTETTPFYDLFFDMELQKSTNAALKYSRVVETYL